MRRCNWCNLKNPKYVAYHDNEWGRLNLDDTYLFEMLILESFQAGLSWECILNKRENFRKAYDNFDLDIICTYDDSKIKKLEQDSGIVRNKRKIKASIQNAKVFRQLQIEFGTFGNYLNTFTNGNILYEWNQTTNKLSDELSKDLQKRGMSFVGSTIIYSFLQAIGIIVSHEPNCDLYELSKKV